MTPIHRIIVTVVLLAAAAICAAAPSGNSQSAPHVEEKRIADLEKELAILKETVTVRLDAEDRRVSDLGQTATAQSNHVALVGNYIAWTSVALALVGLIGGVAVYFNTNRRVQEIAEKSAESFFDEHAERLKQQISELSVKAAAVHSEMEGNRSRVEKTAADIEAKLAELAPSILNKTAKGGGTPEEVAAENTIAEVVKVGEDKLEANRDASDHFAIGLKHYSQSKYSDALACFQRASEIADAKGASQKTRARYLGAQAVVHSMLGNLSDAEVMYQRAITADPNSANNLGNYANFLRRQGRPVDEVEAMYQRAITADPNSANNLGNYGNFLRRQGRPVDEVEAMYQRAITADPEHATSLGNYATFLSNQGRPVDEIEAMYQRAITADPMHANNLGNYAAWLFSTGRTPEARDHLNAAFAALPERPGALHAECWMYAFCDHTGSHKNALGKLKNLMLTQAIRTDDWDFSGVVESAIYNGHPEASWLHKLAAVLGKRAEVESLNDWGAWLAV